jgi:N-succinyldiaminopimelate aminotransferase
VLAIFLTLLRWEGRADFGAASRPPRPGPRTAEIVLDLRSDPGWSKTNIMRAGNRVYAGLGTTIFETMSGLAREHGAVNLGQGFPDSGEPRDVVEVAAEHIRTGWNQYPPLLGLPELRQAHAQHAARFYELKLDWEREILVTSGATEAIAASLFSLIEPGDEVVLLEPAYDAYLPLVLRAGGVPRFVTAHPPAFRVEREALQAALSSRTKCIVVNTPVNPTGRVLDVEEIGFIAEAAASVDAYVLSDEVYEHLVFDGRRPTTLLAHPLLRERALRITSAGKTFSLTGWKVGSVAAAPPLLQLVARAHQFLTFTTPPHLQAAVAYGLGKADAYFDDLANGMQHKRDLFRNGLLELGFSVLPTEGTYFLNVDIERFRKDDVTFCRELVGQVGVAAIPMSSFYAEPTVRNVVRFCFAKKDEVLGEALRRLSRLTI